MEVWQHLIITFLSFLGLPLGYFIITKVPEEKTMGKKYFEHLLPLLFLILLIIGRDSLHYFIALPILIGYFFIKTPHYVYLTFSLYFALLNDVTLFAIAGVLLLGYGLTLGAFHFDLKDKKVYKKMLPYSYVIILGYLLSLIL